VPTLQDLRKILHDDAASELFEAFLAKEYSDENILFWKARTSPSHARCSSSLSSAFKRSNRTTAGTSRRGRPLGRHRRLPLILQPCRLSRRSASPSSGSIGDWPCGTLTLTAPGTGPPLCRRSTHTAPLPSTPTSAGVWRM
jgi:hypothetical protein